MKNFKFYVLNVPLSCEKGGILFKGGHYIIDAVGSSRILIGKQKIGLTFNSDKLGGNDFTKFSKLTMCSAQEDAQALTFLKVLYVKFSPKIRIF